MLFTAAGVADGEPTPLNAFLLHTRNDSAHQSLDVRFADGKRLVPVEPRGGNNETAPTEFKVSPRLSSTITGPHLILFTDVL